MYYMIGLAGFFLLSEVLVQKKIMPKFLKNISAGKTILRSLLILLVVAAIGMLLKITAVLVILATIYLATVISNKYLNVFSDMEGGKKV
ncbi:hypothetical protein M5C72_11225 [Companilactobacillus allii]|uniref:Uncharacterized protein n=1 Tax=Companilactobacillus allii TaxID=1847728 RepID=A0A1P8Q0C5_9LACO|nr:hypothetical protein [Companilactobacillus allii]APX71323.1 hypothetical protein BTM29_01595 [Companilactobacillus allii]USQ68404.1 hypothetical protein M5C72_11225 [Companilactobacillus allii]